MLDEKALRRPGFIGGTRVTLGDGRKWSMPVGLFSTGGPGDGTDQTLTDDEVELLCGSEFDAPLGFIGTLVTLAGRMLRLNYNLASSDLAGLLTYDDSSEGSAKMWRDVFLAIKGGGSGSYSAWLRDALAANGIESKGMPVPTAVNIACGLARQGRAIPASNVVIDAINKKRAREFDQMF